MKKLICLSLFVLIAISQSCIPLPHIEVKYLTFEIPISLTPANDTFSIGDTIYVNIDISQNMKDKETQEEYDFGDNDLLADLLFSRIDIMPQNFANENFDVIAQKGDIIYRVSQIPILDTTVLGGIVSSYDIRLNHEYDKYQLKFKIIPKVYGLFKFLLSFEAANEHIDLIRFGPESTKLKSKINNYEDTNYDLFLTTPDIYLQQIKRKEYDEFGYYTFVVVE